MKRIAIITFFVFCLLLGSGTATAYARKGHIYIVQPGDTLIRIAARHDVSVSQLAHANGLRWNSWVYVGQRLVIPGDVTGSAQSSNAGTYVVQPGDTLIGVAARNGVSVSQLARANGLRWNSWVYFGRQLVIPVIPQTSLCR
ncbi:MAG: LysM peptidoglycan-binding domain-containing protein [Chloroflexota bacterium]|nr:LysM peptidoglycan-binding domain-containing protein [Chloroflexota bacterium]